MSFIHEPLLPASSKPIRLIQISPGSKQLIRCRIRNYATAASNPDYNCLSYQWGPGEISQSMRTIELNGRLMPIRQNLWSFLNVARFKINASGSKYAGMRIWIDALCIDQENVQERNDQVQRMGAIYRNAKIVIVWLGKATSSNGRAAEVLTLQRYLADARRAPVEPDHDFDLEKYGVKLNQGDVQRSRCGKTTRTELSFLVESTLNEYWSRAWIVQEIKSAQNIAIWQGDTEMSLERLSQIYGWAMDAGVSRDWAFGEDSKTGMVHNTAMVKFLRTGPPQLKTSPLLYWLHTFQNTGCKDPRDRIYSLLSLSTEAPDIKVDYGGSRTKLFFQTMWACSRKRFCFCLPAFLMAGLRLHEDPDAEMTNLTSIPTINDDNENKHTNRDSTSSTTAGARLVYMEVDMKITHPIPQPANLLTSLQTQMISTCSCDTFFYPRKSKSQSKPNFKSKSQSKAQSHPTNPTPITTGLILCFQPICRLGHQLHILFQPNDTNTTITATKLSRISRPQIEDFPLPGLTLDPETSRPDWVTIGMSVEAFAWLARETCRMVEGRYWFCHELRARYTVSFEYKGG